MFMWETTNVISSHHARDPDRVQVSSFSLALTLAVIDTLGVNQQREDHVITLSLILFVYLEGAKRGWTKTFKK